MIRSTTYLTVIALASAIALFCRVSVSQDETTNAAAEQAEEATPKIDRGTSHIKGQNFKVRRAIEQRFSDSTMNFGAEFHRDEDTGLLIVSNDEGSTTAVERPQYALISKALATNQITVRWNVYTGESVFSTGNAMWTKIVDETPPPMGFYEVQIAGPYTQGESSNFRAMNRIERNTGRCWYMYDNSWLPYMDPQEDAAAN